MNAGVEGLLWNCLGKKSEESVWLHTYRIVDCHCDHGSPHVIGSTAMFSKVDSTKVKTAQLQLEMFEHRLRPTAWT